MIDYGDVHGRGENKLDSLLAEIESPCECPKCQKRWIGPVAVAVVKFLGDATGTVKVWCPDCELADRNAPRCAPMAPPRAFDDQWAIMCPDEYRLTSEGGQTDRERLKKANGILVDPSGTETKVNAKQIAELIHKRQTVLLGGEPGTMKTRLAWRMVRMIWDTKATVRCFTSWEFQAELQDASGRHEGAKWAADLKQAELVFIDDLGKAEWTANTHGTFFEILEARMNRRKALLITTNESFKSLAEARENHKAVVAQSTAGGIIRRLRDYAQRVVMQKPIQ